MITFKYFLESNTEEIEEKSGIDIDHDEEKGESQSHKDKIHKKKEEMLEFFTKRAAGAEKIAISAKEKGGPSILTFWHFKAKAKPYAEVLKAIKEDKDESFYLKKFKSLLKQLNVGDIKQQYFQELMGEMEVWGESLTKLFV